MSTASSRPKLTTNDALLYLKTVKEIFLDKRDKYEEFLNVMKDFKAQRIDTTGVIFRVKELFRGNRDLILGFNTFLPKGHEITLPPEDELFLKKKPVEFNEAIDFVSKIKTRFEGDDHVYKAFLDILNMYKKASKSIAEVYQEVSVLLQDHADLLVEFIHFLPDISGTSCAPFAQFDKNHILNEGDKDSPMTIENPLHVQKNPAVPNGTTDQYANHNHLEQRNHGEKEKENIEDREKNEWENNDGLDLKRNYAHQDDSVIDHFHQGLQDPELAFHDKVKGQIKDLESCKKISDCIRAFKSKFVTTAQFRMLIASLLGTYADLMDACEDFINYTEKIGSLQSNKQHFRSLKLDGDCVNCDVPDGNTIKVLDKGERDKVDRALTCNNKDTLGQKMVSCASKERFWAKPIQELDLSNCESCTPSYRLLPENYPIPSVSRRTNVGDEVLNDHWVSVTSGSEDYSFKHMRKNQYEESLFRCEDDRFELDMLLESTNTTTKRVEELLIRMNAHANKTDTSFCIEDHLTALDLRCIERLYGEHGVDVMDVLRKNALLSLPIILTRLKQKQDEWARCRADFNKVWADIYAKNYHKSLDHRSFYFKQQDTKNLSAKALLAEIKEMSEMNQIEDEMFLTGGTGYRHIKKLHMEFKYPDADIQNDLYQLVKFSCGEVCSPEQQEKVMKIWTTFLEPFFGVPPHLPDTKEQEDLVKADACITSSADKICRKDGSPADDNAVCKASSMIKSGNEFISTGHSCSGRLLMSGNFLVNNCCSPEAHIVRSKSKSDVQLNAPQTRLMQPGTRILSAESLFSKPTGFMDKFSQHNNAGGRSVNKENASIKCKGPDDSSANFGIEGIVGQEPQDGVITKHTVCSSTSVAEDVKVQKQHTVSEVYIKGTLQEGELSLNRNAEERNFSPSANTDTKEDQIPCKNAPQTTGDGRDKICIEEAGQPTNTNVIGEGEESIRGSSESENASENGDVSSSDSPNVEECSPDDDGDHDENANKAKIQVEADCLVDVHDIDGTMSFSGRFLGTAKPLAVKVPMALCGREKNSQIFYGNDSFYLLFRLHQLLYERMQSAKTHSSSPENKWKTLKAANPTDSYARFKDALCSLLNGSSDNAKFEDECRSIIGAQSYILFTLDKLIHKLIKQLQTVATDEMDNKLLQLYAYERSRSHGTFADVVYCQNARFLLPDDNLYRIECFPWPTHLTVQLMKNEQEKLDPMAVSMDPRFEAYLKNEILSDVPERRARSGVFMKRNVSKFSSRDAACQRAMEGLAIENCMEMKVNCSTLKASYVLETEDFLYRRNTRKRSSNVLCGGESSNGRVKGRKLMSDIFNAKHAQQQNGGRLGGVDESNL